MSTETTGTAQIGVTGLAVMGRNLAQPSAARSPDQDDGHDPGSRAPRCGEANATPPRRGLP